MRSPFSLEIDASWCAVTRAVADRVLGPTPRPLWELVAIVSDAYNREREALLDRTPSSADGLHARVRFYLPRDAMKILPPLGELSRAGLLPKQRWRVLDVGAGLGSTTLGAARAAAALGVPGLDVLAIDRDARALDVFSALASEHAALGIAPIALRTAELDVRRLDALRREGPFDLILCGLVLNELRAAETPRGEDGGLGGAGAVDARRRVLDALHPLLAEDGALIVLEPALREVTRDLHRLRDELASAPTSDGARWTVFAPCLRRGPCPMLEGERDWCHEDVPFALPPPLAAVARDASLRFERLTYSYLTLRRDGRTLAEALGEPLRRVVSMPLVSKGKRELFVCDERGRAILRRLDRDARPENAAFGDAQRGDVLRVADEGARIRGAVDRVD
ncbi:MAG: hypothetical protein KF901_33635 [Myxococcales bacterium]|nr:hypothetical protein [Myxococcales bacterium]